MHVDIPDSELHRRLTEGDPIAPALIVERYLEPLIERLKKSFPSVPDLVEDAVSQALTNYLLRPESYNPELKSLPGYLLMSADGDVRNLLARERRRLKREAVELDADVELGAPRAEYVADEQHNPEHLDLDQDEWEAQIRQHLPDARDREILALMMDGERHTAVFAQVLEISSLPIAEQRAQVKRHKDRIKKRLRRAGIGRRDA